MQIFKEKVRIFLLIFAILSPFIFFSNSRLPWGGDNIMLMFSQNILAPFELGLKNINMYWSQYVNNINATEENIELKKQLAAAIIRKQLANEYKNENVRLRNLLNFVKQTQDHFLNAEVISLVENTAFPVLRINKGTKDHVQIGMAVINPKGVVGRVIRAGYNISDVLLIVDNHFSIDVLLQRTRIRGVLKGNNLQNATMEVQKNLDVKIGDTLITTEFVGGFPKGVPVGKVSRITYYSKNVAKQIIIEPWINYRKIEEVVLLKTVNRNINTIIEATNSNWLKNVLKPFSKGG